MHWLDTRAAVLCLTATISTANAQTFGFGSPATEAEIAGWNISIDRDGANLPPGSGDTVLGKQIYDERCASCHLETGEGDIGDRLVGGQGTLASDKPIKTVGSFWQYATTLYDYIHRAMPQDSPQSLRPDEVYAVTAYLLSLNGVVADGTRLDATSLSAIVMPNRDGFEPDNRPDVKE